MKNPKLIYLIEIVYKNGYSFKGWYSELNLEFDTIKRIEFKNCPSPEKIKVLSELLRLDLKKEGILYDSKTKLVEIISKHNLFINVDEIHSVMQHEATIIDYDILERASDVFENFIIKEFNLNG